MGFRVLRGGVAIILVLFLLASCQSEKIDLSDVVTPLDPVSFSADVQPIFSSSCSGVGCHIGMTTNGVNLTTYNQVMESLGLQYDALVVVPGDAAASPLVDKLGPDPEFGSRMPQDRTPLSGTQIALIRAWIDEGALDN